MEMNFEQQGASQGFVRLGFDAQMLSSCLRLHSLMSGLRGRLKEVRLRGSESTAGNLGVAARRRTSQSV